MCVAARAAGGVAVDHCGFVNVAHQTANKPFAGYAATGVAARHRAADRSSYQTAYEVHSRHAARAVTACQRAWVVCHQTANTVGAGHTACGTAVAHCSPVRPDQSTDAITASDVGVYHPDSLDDGRRVRHSEEANAVLVIAVDEQVPDLIALTIEGPVEY